MMSLIEMVAEMHENTTECPPQCMFKNQLCGALWIFFGNVNIKF
jgi:hypothetical protein